MIVAIGELDHAIRKQREAGVLNAGEDTDVAFFTLTGTVVVVTEHLRRTLVSLSALY